MDESQLTKDLIAQGLARTPRRQMKVIFSGPGAPQGLFLEAAPEMEWSVFARTMVRELEKHLSKPQKD